MRGEIGAPRFHYRTPLVVVAVTVAWLACWAMGWNRWPPNRHDLVALGIPVAFAAAVDLWHHRPEGWRV